MIVRTLDPNDDYQLGQFMANTPATVAQAVKTRLALWEGEWFVDITDGTPYAQDILGWQTNYDIEIQSRILGTPGVTEIVDYASTIIDRSLLVECTIDTEFGITPLSAVL